MAEVMRAETDARSASGLKTSNPQTVTKKEIVMSEKSGDYLAGATAMLAAINLIKSVGGRVGLPDHLKAPIGAAPKPAAVVTSSAAPVAATFSRPTSSPAIFLRNADERAAARLGLPLDWRDRVAACVGAMERGKIYFAPVIYRQLGGTARKVTSLHTSHIKGALIKQGLRIHRSERGSRKASDGFGYWVRPVVELVRGV